MAINSSVLADDVTTTDPVLPGAAFGNGEYSKPKVPTGHSRVRDYTLGELYLGLTGAAVGLGLFAASPAAARWAMTTAFDLEDRPMTPSAAWPETPEERRRTAGSGADFWR